jgi:plastocyanin
VVRGSGSGPVHVEVIALVPRAGSDQLAGDGRRSDLSREDRMTRIAGHARVHVTGHPLVATIAVVIAVGGCSTPAVPAVSTATAPPPASPVATAAAAATPSPVSSPTPSPTVVIVKVTPIPGAPDSGTVVQLVVAHTKWVPNDIAAPAGKVWHVKVDNQDSLSKHNVTIASGPTFPERIFQTAPNFSSGTFSFDMPALPAGNYLFICTIHPETMTGTLTLK